jgi:hypothetical protein
MTGEVQTLPLQPCPSIAGHFHHLASQMSEHHKTCDPTHQQLTVTEKIFKMYVYGTALI